MSLHEIKKILSTNSIKPNKLLGQNFMVDPSLYNKMTKYAQLNKGDNVLDVGAGFGFLASFLSDKCNAVVAVEKDTHVAKVLRERVRHFGNVVVIEGDILKTKLPAFNKVVAIPPYYLSSQLLTWILEKHVDSAVMILQREFSDRLVATVNSEYYSWLTVVTSQYAEVELLDPVPKETFYPSPKVDSAILVVKPHITNQLQIKNEAVFTRMVKWLFTQRNKKLANAIVPFIQSTFKFCKTDAKKIALEIPFYNTRVRELSPQDFGVIINALPN